MVAVCGGGEKALHHSLSQIAIAIVLFLLYRFNQKLRPVLHIWLKRIKGNQLCIGKHDYVVAYDALA